MVIGYKKRKYPFGQSAGIGKRRRTLAPRRKRKMSRRPSSRKGRSGLYSLRMRTPVPDIVVTKHPYNQVNVNPIPVGFTAGGTANNVLNQVIWKASMFDPDYSIGGHQPMFRDEMASKYGKVRVSGIKWSITVNCRGYNAMNWLFVEYSDTPTARSTLTNLMESPNVKKFKFGGANSSGPRTFSGYMACHKALGISRSDFLADEDCIAAVGSNPVRMAYLKFYRISCVRENEFGAGNEDSWDESVNLTLYAQWMNKLVIGPS